jgi:diketogulonate reductase-like aldo/keto reductase
MSLPNIKLADGNTIPQIGLGLWQVKDQAEFNTAVNAAIEAGYRHFDTAQAYDNEYFLGEVWKKSGLKRDELFITTKIAVTNFGHRKALKSFEESLKNLQTDYVDLLLLHFPVTLLRKGAWQALEEIRSTGGTKSIGVSNYTIRHLEEMKSYAKEMPAINQVELHVFLQQPELVKYCRDNNIVVEAYSPLAHAKAMDNEVIAQIAKKHGKTYAQIMLSWLVEQDMVVIPKSVTLSRIRENIDIFDFKLDKEDLAELAKQDRDMRTCWSPVHVP